MNGTGLGAPSSVSYDLLTVTKAIQAIYDPLSSNERRQEASSYLQITKRHPDVSFILSFISQAVDTSQAPEVRHYGLSVLEFIITHRLQELGNEQLNILQECVVQMAKDVREGDQPYLRNKIAQLWLELLQRTWGTHWMDMDEQLVVLWNTSLLNKEVVLYIFEAASEEIFHRDEPAASIQDAYIGKMFADIFSPASVLREHYKNRSMYDNLRCGEDGWLLRMRDFVKEYVDHPQEAEIMKRSCTIKTLSTLTLAFAWIPPKAITETQILDVLVNALTVSDPEVQLASIQALVAIYSRLGLSKDVLGTLVHFMIQPNIIRVLVDLYGWSAVDINNLDESKYSLCKKLAELVSCIGHTLVLCPTLLHGEVDFSSFCTLCMSVLQHQSLLVSIPVLHVWVEMLNSPELGGSGYIAQLYGPLLHISSTRVFRYENLPQNCGDPTVSFLNEDFDNLPEMHVLVGNYRRLCIDLIESIVRRKPLEAIQHILTQTLAVFTSLYDGQPHFKVEAFSKNSQTALRADAQCNVIHAAMKGLSRSFSKHGSNTHLDVRRHIEDGTLIDIRQQQDHNVIQEMLEQWVNQFLQLEFEDPAIIRKMVQVLTDCCIRTLHTKPSVAIRIVGKILSLRIADNANFPAYSEAVKELQTSCINELHRLAMKFPDKLMGVYDDLEVQINDWIDKGVADNRYSIGLETFLFIIIHRFSNIDEGLRLDRLQDMIQHIQDAWGEPQLTRSLSSFESFRDMLGFGHLTEFFGSLRAHKIQDWSSLILDDRGKAIQADILHSSEQLPLARTRALLVASTDKLAIDSATFDTARKLWRGFIAVILLNLLVFIKYSHAFQNLANWGQVSQEMQAVLKRVFTDRFWQVGISTGSRDVFYAKILASKSTLEGFGSTVRGAVRQVRETAYWTIVALGVFGEDVYGIKGFPGALALAFFADSEHLSTHQTTVLLSVTQILIDRCPPSLRQNFVPPVLAGLFSKLDIKICQEWANIEELKMRAAEDDDLGEEMKNESILRTLTFSAVSYVATLTGSVQEEPHTKAQPPLHAFIFSAPATLDHQRMLESLIIFCTHALRLRDSRSCMVITRVFRSLITRFSSDDPAVVPIRDFISKDVLMACIESLHEPYFVDVQKDLASVIAAIIALYSAKTTIPRQIIMSLPGMDEEKVDRAIKHICDTTSERRHRALVLDLLASVRGVSIHEQGRIEPPVRKKVRSVIQERYMVIDTTLPSAERGPSPDLGGVADMFGGGEPSGS